METNILKISTEEFTYHPNTRTFIQEISMLYARGYKLTNLFDSKLKIAFYLVSKKTKKEVPFTFHCREEDDSLIYIPVEGSFPVSDPNNNLKVIILND